MHNLLLTAMFEVHLRDALSSIRLKAVTPSGAEFGPVGYEINLLYLAGLATIALFGAGKLSVDRFLQTRVKLPARAKRHEARVEPGAAARSVAPARGSSAGEIR